MFADGTNIIDMALANGKYNTAILLHEIGAADLSDMTFEHAVNTGDMHAIIYFANAGGRLHSDLYKGPIAAERDNVIKYLLDIGCPFSDDIIEYAKSKFAYV
jgi:hypothetical protein